MSNAKTRPSTYKKLKPAAKLVVIASRKRWGDVTLVSKLSNYSVPYVSQVLNGKFINKHVINAAYIATRGRKKNSTK